MPLPPRRPTAAPVEADDPLTVPRLPALPTTVAVDAELLFVDEPENATVVVYVIDSVARPVFGDVAVSYVRYVKLPVPDTSESQRPNTINALPDTQPARASTVCTELRMLMTAVDPAVVMLTFAVLLVAVLFAKWLWPPAGAAAVALVPLIAAALLTFSQVHVVATTRVTAVPVCVSVIVAADTVAPAGTVTFWNRKNWTSAAANCSDVPVTN